MEEYAQGLNGAQMGRAIGKSVGGRAGLGWGAAWELLYQWRTIRHNGGVLYLSSMGRTKQVVGSTKCTRDSLPCFQL